jgi:molybdenum cofactor cytidylyltransferase
MALKNWSAVILAAGAAHRFGSPKMLALLGGVPVIRRTAEAVGLADFGEVLVVAGAQADAITDALVGMDCRIVPATDWREGMAASLRAGIAAVAPRTNGAFVFLGDMPLVPMDLCQQLADLAETAGYAARPVVAGKPGHPACFMRSAFADLLRLTGDCGATGLLQQRTQGVAYLATDAAGAMLDIDAPGDLAAAERVWNSRVTSASSASAISRGALPNP